MQPSSPTGPPPPLPHRLDPEIATVSDALSRFMLEEPELPGVHDLLAFTKSHLARGFTSSDLDILSGALYLEAEHQLHGNRPGQAAADVPSPTRQRRPITADDVRAALSKPISTAAYGREYFKKMLEEAKASLTADPGFRTQLEAAEASAKGLRKRHKIDTPVWILAGMAVILTVMIVAAILLI